MRIHGRRLWRLPAGDTASAALDRLGLSGRRATHTFDPVGTSAVCVGPDVTVAIHTWPEHGLATLDHYGPLPAGAEDRLVAAGWTPLPEARRC